MKKLKVVLGVLAIAGVFAMVNSSSTNVEDLNQESEIVLKLHRASCTGEGHIGPCASGLPTNG